MIEIKRKHEERRLQSHKDIFQALLNGKVLSCAKVHYALDNHGMLVCIRNKGENIVVSDALPGDVNLYRIEDKVIFVSSVYRADGSLMHSTILEYTSAP